MRILTQLDPDTYDQIEEIVREAGYRDVDQFIRVSVQNQLSIERSEEENVVVTNPENVINMTDGKEFEWKYSVPVHSPANEAFEMERDTQLLFQQYYRFFPLKVVMVELAKQTEAKDGPVLLEEFRSHMGSVIKPLRDRILEWEDKNNIKKKHRKSTGLPKINVKNPEYSERRFLDHFVGKIRKRDLMPKSFGHTLGFISFNPVGENKCLIQLTPEGNQMIQLENPLLESGPTAPTLSIDERQYLVTHLEKTLTEEYRLMEFIYSILQENGQETYTNCMDGFREYLLSADGFTDDNPSEDRVRSQIAGTLSRMVELGIFSRGAKRGVYVPETPPAELTNAAHA